MEIRRASQPTRRYHPVYRGAFAAAYLVDLALAPRVDIRDSLIVSGFWRSGTTWIQNSLAELLHAKIIFEPFHYYVPEMHQILERMGILAGHPHPNMYMPGEGGISSLNPVVRKALQGALRGRWVRLYRLRWPDAFRTRVIVKFTRAALVLHAMQNTFCSPVLHISRDPRAVVASVVYKTDHMGGKFSQAFSLEQDLIRPGSVHEDYFRDWQTEIRTFDQKPLSIKIAAYWSLTERWLADSFSQRSRTRTCFIQYEDIARDPETGIMRVIEHLGYAKPLTERMSILHSKSLTSVFALNQDTAQMIRGWRSVMPAAEAAEVAAIARDFGFEDRLRS